MTMLTNFANSRLLKRGIRKDGASGGRGSAGHMVQYRFTNMMVESELGELTITQVTSWGAWRRTSNDPDDVGHAGTVERAAHSVITHTGQVFHTAAADQHHRVLLQVVAFAADVADDFEAIGQANLRHFAQRRVRLFRRRGVHARAHAALLRAGRQRGHLRLVIRRGPRLANELTDSGHNLMILRETRGRPCGGLRRILRDSGEATWDAG